MTDNQNFTIVEHYCVTNPKSEGFAVLKELIATFSDYRASFSLLDHRSDVWAASLLYDAYYCHQVDIAIYLCNMGRDQHPFLTFFPYAFEYDFYEDKSHEFEEKIQILDAINNGYNFRETFRTDYELIKQHFFYEDFSDTQEYKLVIKNIIIFDQYVQMNGMSTIQLLGELEYNRVKKIIPELAKNNTSQLEGFTEEQV